MADAKKEKKPKSKKRNFVSTRNACKLCTPLGACVAFMGVEGAVPFLHGSQGCATYIRRYMISHFKEPVDIASSSFSEDSAVFGGGDNLKAGLENVRIGYKPELIGLATTCLSETIGDDVKMFVREYKEENLTTELPRIVHVSTPSYTGTHYDGFHDTVKALVEQLSGGCGKHTKLNIFPGFVSPADIRHIKEICTDFGIEHTVLPDYSERLDGGGWKEYHRISTGGTPLKALEESGGAPGTVEMGRVLGTTGSAGKYLQAAYNVPLFSTGIPIGIEETDCFMQILKRISGGQVPAKYKKERSRLVDAYADGHKYVFGKRAVIFGEEDLVVALAAFLSEIGIVPVLCASGGKSGWFEKKIAEVFPDYLEKGVVVKEGMDFADIDEAAVKIKPDLLIGNSKGYKMARSRGIPLVRSGFPIHDRFGGQRLLQVGYRGTQMLFDRIVNTIIEQRQEESPVGYTYI